VGRLLTAAFIAAALVAPATARAEESLARRYDPGMVAAGTVLSVSGSFGLLIGSTLTLSAGGCEEDCGRRDAWPAALAGGLAIVGSIPLLVIGSDPSAPAEGVAERAFRVSLRAAPSTLSVLASF
jgi:hypothetical protein